VQASTVDAAIVTRDPTRGVDAARVTPPSFWRVLHAARVKPGEGDGDGHARGGAGRGDEGFGCAGARIVSVDGGASNAGGGLDAATLTSMMLESETFESSREDWLSVVSVWGSQRQMACINPGATCRHERRKCV